MALTFGQLASGAGAVSTGMRQAEEAQRVARQNQLKIEAQNRANEERSRLATFQAGLKVPAMPDFTGGTGGQPFGVPQAAPVAAAPTGAQAFPVNMNAPQAVPVAAIAPSDMDAGGFPLGAAAPTPAPAADGTPLGNNELTILGIPTGRYARTDSPIGRSLDVAAGKLNERQERDALRTRLNYKYGPAAGFGGLFVAQTDEQRKQAQEIMNRLPTLSTEELRQLEATGQLPPKTAPRAGIRPELAEAMEQTESGGVTTAVSPKGATGLMQVMIPTALDPGFGLPTVFEFAQQQGVEVRGNTEDEARRLLKDPKIGKPYGLLYADTMSQRYGGDETLMLVAYNWGPGNADKWAASGRNPMDLPSETRDYVIKNLGLAGGNKPTFDANPTKTADRVATAAAAPATSGMMFGPTEVAGGAQNPGVQSALMLRQMFAEQYRIAAEVGSPDKAMEALSQVAAIDLGLYKAQADQGVYELSTSGDASRAMSVLSQFTGIPTQALSRGDGTYDLYQNGRVTQTAVPIDKLADLIRTQVDAGYRQQKAELTSGLAKERAQASREFGKAEITGQYSLAVERMKQSNPGVKITNLGDGRAIIDQPGRQPYAVDLNQLTEEETAQGRIPTGVRRIPIN